MTRERWSLPRFRMATMMVAIALIALAMGGLRVYLSPSLVWRRAVHQPGRNLAWGEATAGKIAGLTPRQSIDEVAQILNDTDDRAVASAVVAYPLIEPEVDLAIDRLALRMKSRDPKVRRLAAGALETAVRPDGSGRDRAFPFLIAALGDPDSGVRRRVALALGSITDRVGPSLTQPPDSALRALLLDGDRAVRFAAALALARGGAGEEAVPLLASFVLEHREQDCDRSDCPLAFQAILVLAPRSDRAASALIAGAYAEGRGPSAEVLATIGGVVANDFRAKVRLSGRAKDALRSSNPDLRLSAALALARIDEAADAVPGLAEAFDRGTEQASACAEGALRRIAFDQPDAIRAILADASLGEGTRSTLRELVGDPPVPR